MKLVLFFIYLFIEIYFIVLFADEFGILSVFLEIILSAFIGIGILSSQYSVMIESYNNIFRNKNNIGNFLGKSFFRLIGGVLLIIPGIFSDIIGLGFFITSLFFTIKSKEKDDDSKDDIFMEDFDNSEIIDVEIIEEKKNIK